MRPLTNQQIPAVNFHLWEPCNMRCGFCFATFQDVTQSVLPKGHLPKEQALQVVTQLCEAGFSKINFAGGEPTLCPWLYDLIACAKSYGATTSIVTNGTKVNEEWLKKLSPILDWVGLSIDSFNAQTNLKSGRAIVGKKTLWIFQFKLCQLFQSVTPKYPPETFTQQFGNRQHGGFVDIVQPIYKGKAFNWQNAVVNLSCRLEYVDWNVGTFKETGSDIGESLWSIMPSVSFRPTSQTVLRLNYRHLRQKDLLGNPPAITGGFIFGLSTYF